MAGDVRKAFTLPTRHLWRMQVVSPEHVVDVSDTVVHLVHLCTFCAGRRLLDAARGEVPASDFGDGEKRWPVFARLDLTHVLASRNRLCS